VACRELRRALANQWFTSLGLFYRESIDKKEKHMANSKVFVGYDYDNDKAAKDRLRGWDTNKEFDFSSYDRFFDVAVDSPEAVAIQQDLAARIDDSSHLLCIVGKET
jgi:hypothetical protein